MNSYQRLIDARAKIENIEDWATVSPIVYSKGKPIRYCAIGALGYLSLSQAKQDPAVRLLMAACAKLYAADDPTWVNDILGHDCILKAFDEAISMAYQEEGGAHDSVDGGGQGIGHNRADNPVILVVAHRQMVVPQRSAASEWCETTGLNIGGGKSWY